MHAEPLGLRGAQVGNLCPSVSNTIARGGGSDVSTDFKYHSSHFRLVGARRDVKKEVPH